MKRRSVLLAAAMMIAGAAQLANAQGESPPHAALYEKAKREGPITWYTSLDAVAAGDAIEGFNKIYPDIEVTLLRLTSGAVAARYAQERGAGTVGADVVTIANPPFFADAVARGWFVTNPNLPSLPNWPQEFYKEGRATVVVLAFGIAYNTDIVAGPDVPRTWTDMLKPQFKGKILFGDPRSIPAYLGLYKVLMEDVDESFLLKLKAQDLKVVASVTTGIDTLGASGAALLFPGTTQIVEPLKAKGAPVEFVQPSPTTGFNWDTMISSGERQNAAALLMDFLLTKEGQFRLNNHHSTSPLGGVGGLSVPLPSGYVTIDHDAAHALSSEMLEQLGLR